jgi:protein-tyrosine kinase
MDFIQKAIDKARQQRQEREIEPGAGPEPELQLGNRVSARQSHRFEYTQTRSIKPTDDWLRQNRVVAGLEHDERAENYRQLRTQILRKFRDEGWRTLAVTSPNSRAGKTLTALNLAISLSLEVNQTVLLVDLDLRNPSVLEKLGIQSEYGLVDYLEGRAQLSDVLVNPGFERLVILPSKPGSYRSELLSSPQMGELLHDIVSRYESRLIIFDLPALLDDDDALVFAPYADATLLVVEDGVSKRSDITRSLQLLEGTKLLGTVLNKMR